MLHCVLGKYADGVPNVPESRLLDPLLIAAGTDASLRDQNQTLMNVEVRSAA
jgi:hypothetical protein